MNQLRVRLSYLSTIFIIKLSSYRMIIRKQSTTVNVKKREIKLKESSSEPTIEIEFKLRQTNGWEVYNESGESEVLSNTDVLSLSVHKYDIIIYGNTDISIRY